MLLQDEEHMEPVTLHAVSAGIIASQQPACHVPSTHRQPAECFLNPATSRLVLGRLQAVNMHVKPQGTLMHTM